MLLALVYAPAASDSSRADPWKGCGAANILAPEFFDLFSQVPNLLLQLADQADKIVSTEGFQIRHKTLWFDHVFKVHSF
jgi:hypothetical protein